jgi:hypothetical protein
VFAGDSNRVRDNPGPQTAWAGDAMTITKLVTSIAALALLTSSALAADIVRKAPPKPVEAAPASCFDLAVGGGIQSDYNFRGISQSDKGPGVWAYAEPRCNITKDIQLYAGIWGWSTKLPTTPTGEFDLYGGIRLTFGPVAFDFGAMYYWYPRERQLFFADPTLTTVSPTNFGFGPFTVSDTDFWEVYGKMTWTVTDWLAIGPYVYYSPNWLQTGAKATYAGGTVKLTAPSAWFPTDWGAYLSGEAAHYWIGTLTAFGPPFVDLPDYTYWNVGVGVTYKIFTFDLRYHDTDLSDAQCFVLTGDPAGVATGRTNWCGATVIGKFSFDLTALTNLK